MFIIQSSILNLDEAWRTVVEALKDYKMVAITKEDNLEGNPVFAIYASNGKLEEGQIKD